MVHPYLPSSGSGKGENELDLDKDLFFPFLFSQDFILLIIIVFIPVPNCNLSTSRRACQNVFWKRLNPFLTAALIVALVGAFRHETEPRERVNIATV
jgi:hypothetical protein